MPEAYEKVGDGETLFEYCRRVGLTYERMIVLDKKMGRPKEPDIVGWNESRGKVDATTM